MGDQNTTVVAEGQTRASVLFRTDGSVQSVDLDSSREVLPNIEALLKGVRDAQEGAPATFTPAGQTIPQVDAPNFDQIPKDQRAQAVQKYMRDQLMTDYQNILNQSPLAYQGDPNAQASLQESAKRIAKALANLKLVNELDATIFETNVSIIRRWLQAASK